MFKHWLLLIFIVVSQSYSIDGIWQSPKDRIIPTYLTFEHQSFSKNGTTTLRLLLSSCPQFQYSLNIYESFIKITSPSVSFDELANCQVSTGSTSSIIELLEKKILFFEIIYDQLILRQVLGNTSITLTRVKKNRENHFLMNNFYVRGLEKSPLILSSGNSFILCGGELVVDYETNNIDTISLNLQTIVDSGCKDGRSALLIQKLKNIRYYRKIKTQSIILFDIDYLSLAELTPASMPRYAPNVNLKVPMLELNSQIDANAWKIVNSNPVLSNINSINHIQNIEVQTNIFSNSDVHLIGSYHPFAVGGKQINSSLSEKLIYIFSLNSVYVIGTCLNYNYDYSVVNGTFIQIKSNLRRQIKSLLPSTSECDINIDRSFLNPLEKAQSYRLTATRVVFMNSNAQQLILQRI